MPDVGQSEHPDAAPFRSTGHAWAAGIITGVLMAHPELVVTPVTDETQVNYMPEVHVQVGRRSFRLVIEELQ